MSCAIWRSLCGHLTGSIGAIPPAGSTGVARPYCVHGIDQCHVDDRSGPRLGGGPDGTPERGTSLILPGVQADSGECYSPCTRGFWCDGSHRMTSSAFAHWCRTIGLSDGGSDSQTTRM